MAIPSRLPLGPSDVFAVALDRIIRRGGGAGNAGVLVLRLEGALDEAGLAAAWAAFGRAAWPAGGRIAAGLRGMALHVRGPARLRIEVAADDPAQLRHRLLAEGSGAHRLRLVRGRGCVGLAWDHALCDARAAQGILAALPGLAAGGALGEAWWAPGYRDLPGMPRRLAERGPLAGTAIALLKPHRQQRLWKPLGRASPANPAAPLHAATLALGEDGTRRAQANQRAAVGRMAESAFLLAACAAALEDLGGVRGDVLFPLAIDARMPGERRLLANAHGYAFLRLPAGLASRDLAGAARHLQQAHRAWLAADGCRRLAASLDWFAWLPDRLARAELGAGGPGVHASAVVACTGRALVPAGWFGARVAGIDHGAALPGCPGIGALFHHDARGLVIDALAAGAVAAAIPPLRLAERIRDRLLAPPMAGNPASPAAGS